MRVVLALVFAFVIAASLWAASRAEPTNAADGAAKSAQVDQKSTAAP